MAGTPRIILGNFAPVASSPMQLRCPVCLREALMSPVGQDTQAQLSGGPGLVRWGARACPNPNCGALVLFTDATTGDRLTYPAETIDFDATDLPNGVQAALEEAVQCHASGCYVAAAIMVRKTLEMLCHDQGATGGNLFQRLSDLTTKIVMPQAMMDALQDLRLLGNDAAHVESNIYDSVGQDEVEAAIAVTKEILKAAYQYKSLLGQLAALKKTP